MIKNHQPKIFGTSLIVALSSTEDGSMSTSNIYDETTVRENRRKFLSRNMIALSGSVLCQSKGSVNTSHLEVDDRDKGKGMIADTEPILANGIATNYKKCALFLPVDGGVVVLYDSGRQGGLMVVKLSERLDQAIIFMKEAFGSKPENLLVWIGPILLNSINLCKIALHSLDAAGIKSEHIEICKVEVAKDYCTNENDLNTDQHNSNVYAIVAMLR